MIVHDVEQGGDAWKALRLGLPTSSSADKLLTAKTLKPSTQSVPYMARLLAEYVTGEADCDAQSAFMDRGNDLEDQARGWYEIEHEADVYEVGFLTTDDETFGCSPDGLVGDDGGLEIKCPSASVHMGYWMDPSKLTAKYRLQVQSSLWLTGRKWWDLVSHNPVIENVVVRVLPDPKFVAAWEPVIRSFAAELNTHKERYEEQREGALVSNPFA